MSDSCETNSESFHEQRRGRIAMTVISKQRIKIAEFECWAGKESEGKLVCEMR